MPLSRLTQIWAKTEANYADGLALAATDAVLVKNLDVKVEPGKYNRSMDGNTLSRMRSSVLGQRHCTVSFDLALRGNSAALTALVEPIYARFLRACGFAGTWDATGGAENWSYKPTTAGAQGQSVAFEVYWDGLKRSVIGCRGTFSGTATPGEVCMLKFQFQGLYKDIDEVVTPNGDYTSDVAPPIVQGSEFKPWTENAGADVFGAVYGVTFDVRNQIKLVGSNTVVAASSYAGLSRVAITGRGSVDDPGMAGTMMVEQKATGNNPNDWWERWEDRTTSASCALKIGTAANNRHLITMPKLELDGIQQADSDGVLVHQCDLRLQASAARDDELSFTTYKVAA